MKPLLLKTLILSLTYLFLIPLSGQPDGNYTEEDFRRDKELFQELEKRFMYYYTQRKDDSLYFLLHDNLPKLERAHQFRPNDTLIAVFYKYSKINYGVQIAFYSRNMEKAIQIATPAYEDAWNDPMVNWHYNLATTAVNMADLYRLIGDKEKGLWYLQRSLEVKRRLYGEKHPLVANQYKYIGIVYDEFGEYKRAEYYFFKALEIYKANFGEYTNGVTWNLVWCYFKQNRKKEAFELLNQRINRFESGISNNVRGHCTLLKLRGDLYLKENQFLKAKSNYIGILNNIRKSPIKFTAKNYHVAPGEDYNSFESSNLDFYVFAYQSLGDVELKLENYDQAVASYNNAIKYDKLFRGEKSPLLSNLKLPLALAYANVGEYSLAEKNWVDAVSSFISNSDNIDFDSQISLDGILPTSFLLEAFFIKALIFRHRATSDAIYIDKTLETYELIDQFIKKMISQVSYSSSNLIELKSLVSRYYEEGIFFLLQEYENTQNRKYLDLVFRFVENSKTTTLLTSLFSSKAQKFYQVSPNLLSKEKETNMFLSLAEKALFEEDLKGKDADFDRIDQLTAKVNTLRIRQDSILQILQKNHPEYYRFKYQSEIPGLREVQAFLRKENRSVLEYFMGDKYLFTFLIEPDQVRYRVDEIQNKNLRGTVDAFLNPLKRPDLSNPLSDFEAFAESGTALHKLLNLDLLTSDRQSNYLIIPDGFLHLLPFHLLPAEAEGYAAPSFQDYPYLFKSFTTSTDYSTSLYILSQDQRRKYRTSYLGFAPMYRSGSTIRGLEEEEQAMWEGRFPLISRNGVDSLQFNRAEVLECAEIFEGQPYIEDQAREYAFKQNAADAGILHMAMHAFLDDVNPLYSRLAFNLEGEGQEGEDELLYAYELYNTRLNADLAILSACNTGAGRVAKGEGVMSLSHAFKYAGCPNVVLNFWPANDKSSKDLVVSFARHLKEGKGKAEALNEARKEYLQSAAPSDAHPYFWGGLTLIGDDEVVMASSGNRGWLIGLALVGIIALISFRKKWTSST